MDDFFFEYGLYQVDDDDLSLFGSIDMPATSESSFVPYTGGSQPPEKVGGENLCGPKPACRNMNKRMIEFQRRSWEKKNGGGLEPVNGRRCHNHVIRERSRREREREGYMALHSLLPHGTKNDKNSIVQMAGRTIRETRRCKEMLEKRSNELQGELASMASAIAGSTKIRFRVANPASGLDSVLEVLKRLKSLGSKATSVQSKFSDAEVVAVIDVDSKIEEGAEVNETVERTLQEVERKLHSRRVREEAKRIDI